MNEARFWQLIEDNVDRSDITELDVSGLENVVAGPEPDEIASFGHHYDRVHQALPQAPTNNATNSDIPRIAITEMVSPRRPRTRYNGNRVTRQASARW